MSFDQLLKAGGFNETTLADFASMVAWWAADQLTGLSDTNTFDPWTDEYTGGNDLAAFGSRSDPIYRTGGPNGLPFIRFDGTEGVKATWTPFSQPYTIVAVMRAHALATDIYMDGDDNARRHFLWRTSVDDSWTFASATQRVSGTAVDTDWHVMIMVYDSGGDDSKLYMDGVLLDSGDTGTDQSGGLTLGCSNTEGNLADVDYAEVAMYSDAKSATVVQSITNLLGAKYAIASIGAFMLVFLPFTYSPTNDVYETTSESQFTIPIDFATRFPHL